MPAIVIFIYFSIVYNIVYGDVQKADYRGRAIKIAKKIEVGSITGVIYNLKDEHMVKDIEINEDELLTKFL